MEKFNTMKEVSDKIKELNKEIKECEELHKTSKKNYEDALQSRRYYYNKMQPYKKLRWASLASFGASIVAGIASFAIIATQPLAFGIVFGASAVMGTCSFFAVKRDFNKISTYKAKYKEATRWCVKNYRLMENTKEQIENLYKERKGYTLKHLEFLIRADNKRKKQLEEEKQKVTSAPIIKQGVGVSR